MNAVLSQGDDQISHSSSKAVTTEIAHLKKSKTFSYSVSASAKTAVTFIVTFSNP